MSCRWGKVPWAAAPPAPPEAGGSPKSTSRLRISRAPSLRSRAETTPAAFPDHSPKPLIPLPLPLVAFEFSGSHTPAACSGWRARKPRCDMCGLMQISCKALRSLPSHGFATDSALQLSPPQPGVRLNEAGQTPRPSWNLTGRDPLGLSN